jgi:hypothetical protein
MTTRNDDKTGRASEAALRELHATICRHYSAMLDSGKPMSMDMAVVLREFLKDNGHNVSVAHLIDPVAALLIPVSVSVPLNPDDDPHGDAGTIAGLMRRLRSAPTLH